MSDTERVQGIVISTDPAVPVSVETVDVSDAGLYAAVGNGDYEVVPLGECGAAYLNAYGKTKRLAANPRATRLIAHFRPGFSTTDQVAGPVIVVGFDVETGSIVDVEQQIRDAALSWPINPAEA